MIEELLPLDVGHLIVNIHFLAQDVIHTSRAYATMSVCFSVGLSVKEIHWHTIAYLGFKF